MHKITIENVHPMNNDLCQTLLGMVSQLSTPRAGLRFLDRYFTEPAPLDSGWLPGSAGVYAILVSDPSWQPRPYRPIYFGEARDLAGMVIAPQQKYEEWRRAAGPSDQLYVAYHLMSGSDAERAALAEGLIREYRSERNTESSDPGGGDSQGQLSRGAAGG